MNYRQIYIRRLILACVLIVLFNTSSHLYAQDTTILLSTLKRYKAYEYSISKRTIDSLIWDGIDAKKIKLIEKYTDIKMSRSELNDTLRSILGKKYLTRKSEFIDRTISTNIAKWPYSEKIIIFRDSAKYEYCQEIYGRLTCEFDTYVKTDSTILYTDRWNNRESWYYSQINDSLYQITKYYSTGKEIGYATSLLPLKKTGNFKVYNIDRQILTIIYEPNEWYYFANTTLFADSVYTPNLVDVLPQPFLTSEKLKQKIYDNMKFYWYMCDISSKIYVEAVITKQGKVTNPKLVRSTGYNDREYEAIKSILLLPDFTPAEKEGVPVNCKLIFCVETYLK